MSRKNRHDLKWTRRTLLQAGAGAAAYALAGDLYAAEIPSLDSGICVDADVALADIGSKSKLAAALRQFSLEKGPIPIEEHVTPGEARGLSFAPRDPAAAAPTDVSKAAFQNKWKGIDTLNVFFMNGMGATAKLIDTVFNQLQQWSNCCNMKFRHTRSISDSDLRVGFIPGKGHFSTVGIDARLRPGAQTMNLDMDDRSIELQYNLGVVLHEFGHALGMIHEHQNPDSKLDFLPASDPRMIRYFGDRGLRDVQLIQDNIVKRYSATQMLKFSKFDSDSIMLYAFPKELTVNGVGSKQNTVLSATDKKYAALLYGPGPDTTSEVTDDDVAVNRELAITVGGEAAEGKLAAGQTVDVKVTVPSGDGRREITIYTMGTTRVMMSLADSSGKDLTPRDTRHHGTPDLMNEVIRATLPAGEYKVTISHPSARGGGAFKIQATTAAFNRFLGAPNERQ